MARQQQNNVQYFPHPVSHGKKMFYIENKYKNDGYATWFKLLEALGEADYHYLDVRDEMNLMFLESKCKVPIDTLQNIIKDLVNLGEFDKELYSIGILYSDKFIDSIKDAYKKRVNPKPTRKQGVLVILKEKDYDLSSIYTQYETIKDPIYPRIDVQEAQSTPGNTQSKVEYSKVEEIKGEESKEPPFFDPIYPTGDEHLKTEKINLVQDICSFFNMGEEKLYYSQQSDVLLFLNLISFQGLYDHFKTQWENYKAYKNLAGNPHTLFGFIGKKIPGKNEFENQKWNSSNWGAMLAGYSANVPGKKQTVEEAIAQATSSFNPHDPNAPAPADYEQ